MDNQTRFIIIDDDPVNNYICRIVLKKFFDNVDLMTFTIPEKGIEYIEKDFPLISSDKQVVLFLDLNMPGMTGWDVLNYFDKLSEEIKKRIKIYILSSSVDDLDKRRAVQNKYVEDYIVKPLTFDVVRHKLAME